MAHNCIHDMLYMCYSMHINCHIRALFVNGHRIATNCHIHEWDVVATRFLQILQVKQWQILSPPLISGYPGQAQSCPFINVLCAFSVSPSILTTGCPAQFELSPAL